MYMKMHMNKAHRWGAVTVRAEAFSLWEKRKWFITAVSLLLSGVLCLFIKDKRSIIFFVIILG